MSVIHFPPASSVTLASRMDPTCTLTSRADTSTRSLSTRPDCIGFVSYGRNATCRLAAGPAPQCCHVAGRPAPSLQSGARGLPRLHCGSKPRLQTAVMQSHCSLASPSIYTPRRFSRHRNLPSHRTAQNRPRLQPCGAIHGPEVIDFAAAASSVIGHTLGTPELLLPSLTNFSDSLTNIPFPQLASAVPDTLPSIGFNNLLTNRPDLSNLLSHSPDFTTLLPNSSLPQLASLGPDIALGPGVVAQVLDDLGLEALALLATTVLVVPTCKRLKVSPILGFLGAGVLLNQLGFFRNVSDLEGVSELGILFLLFQMGLELSLERLKELSVFAFGLGLSQIILCTAVIAALVLPPENPFSFAHVTGPLFSSLSSTLHLPSVSLGLLNPDLRSRLSSLTVDETVIIALALSLSSSAFVLNLLSEQKEMNTRHGSATLGVLLMQDIAVVPLLAVLPVLEGGFNMATTAASVAASTVSTVSTPVATAIPVGMTTAGVAAAATTPSVASSFPDLFSFAFPAATVATTLGATVIGDSSASWPSADVSSLAYMAAGASDMIQSGFSPGSIAVAKELLFGALKSLLGLGGIVLGGQLVIKPALKLVKQSESSEAFLAMCLLAVTGTALLATKVGFSDSLGAFLAGVILSSSHLKEDVQEYTAPFEKLLLGLFFMTTGSSIDLGLLVDDYPVILSVLGGLILIKTTVISLIAPRFGLSPSESVRTAFLLSQGGEFAFVVLALAKELGVLPDEANQFLIIVVVLSMALTPLLNEMGRVAARGLDLVFPPPSSQAKLAGGVERTAALKDDKLVLVDISPLQESDVEAEDTPSGEVEDRTGHSVNSGSDQPKSAQRTLS